MKFNNIKAILCDIDGTLYFKEKVIDGSIETISKLKSLGIKLLFLTNTDSRNIRTIYQKLKNLGFDIEESQIFSPIIALKGFLMKKPDSCIYLVSTKEVRNEFNEFRILDLKTAEIPDYVIISDFQDDWDLNRINNAFRFVLKGAKLLGTQGNKYYLNREGEPVIDTGSFVKMISYAANIKAHIFGKPSRDFFHQALQLIDANYDSTMVIGDDIESDIQGAINSGIKSVLVKTGKGSSYNYKESSIKPDSVIRSLNSVLDLLK